MLKDFSIFQIVFAAIFIFLAIGGFVAFLTYQASSNQSADLLVWTDIDNRAYLDHIRQSRSDDIGTVTVMSFNSENLVQELISELSLGKSPDVIITNSNRRFELGDRLRKIPFDSLTPSGFTETYVDGAYDAFIDKDGFVGVPLLIDPLVLYSNDRLSNEFGITRPPQTWDEVSNITNSFAKRSGLEVVRSIIPLGTVDNIRHSDDIFYSMLGQVDVKPIYFENEIYKSGVRDYGGESVLSYYTDFANINSGVYNWSTSMPESIQAFASEETIYYLGKASEANEINALNPNIKVSYSVFPQIRDRAKYVQADFIGAMFPTRSDNFAAAVSFVSNLQRNYPEANLVGGSGLSLASRANLNTSAKDPLDEVSARSALYAGTWPQLNSSSLKSSFSELISNTLYRGVGISSALSEYDEDVTIIIDSYE